MGVSNDGDERAVGFASVEAETAVGVSLKGIKTCGLRCGNDDTATLNGQ